MQVKSDATQESDSERKARNIAEILGMISEGRRGRDWLLKEIKKHRLKHPLKSAMNSYEILDNCSSEFVDKLHGALKGDYVPGFEDAQSMTMTYHWLFTDIVGGSDPTASTNEQVRKIVVLNELMSRTETFRNRERSSTIILPVGDGVAIGFGDSPEKPFRLAIELHNAFFRYNESRSDKEKISIRIGIDMGPVYFVKDLNGKDNVWGPGIILTRRVMDLCGPMNIFTSARIAEDLRKLSPEYSSILHSIGNYSIKHGEELSIYNIYGNGFGNKSAPRKAKVALENLQKDIQSVYNFAFNEIMIHLEILDANTMLTRHRWGWNVVNVSKDSMSQIFYSLDGDSPKEFGEMNVQVRDNHDNMFEILSVNVNKPYHKEFNIQLNNPIKPKQSKTLILEYDWEEPERSFYYNLVSGCKKFGYSITAPESLDMKIRLYKVDAETGSKKDEVPQPSIEVKDGKRLVTWVKNDVHSGEAYQLVW